MYDDKIRPDTHVGVTAAGQNAILVPELLQNYTMHLLMSTQLTKKTYDEVSKITPVTTSTKFMSLAVKASEKHRLLDRETGKTKCRIDSNEVIYSIQKPQWSNSSYKSNGDYGNSASTSHVNQGAMGTTPQGNTGYRGNKPYGKTQINAGNIGSTQYGNNRGCFRCGKPNHFARECKVATYCTVCRIKGHNTEVCRKNTQKTANKYCSICNRYNSHDTRDCYSKGKKEFKPQGQGVRMIEARENEFEDPDVSYDDQDHEEGCEN
jgi:hypothetical protein